MKTLVGLAALLLGCAPLCRGESSNFTVDLISPSKANLYVDGAWDREAECLQVKLSVQEEVADPVMKAYFYDSDGNLLHVGSKPTNQGSGQGSIVRVPRVFEKGQEYEVFFGVAYAAAKWKRAIVVFGKPGDYAARVYPKDDLAKFDFPEKAGATIAATASPNTNAPALDKPVGEFETLKGQFEARVKTEVQQPFEGAVRDLNAKYIVALERAQENAQKYGRLEEAVAIKADKDAVATGRGVPAADDKNTLPVVKQLRGTYRVAFKRVEEDRVRRLQSLQGPFARALDALVTSLTREGKLEEAMAVKYQRQQLNAAVANPALGMTGQRGNATSARTPDDRVILESEDLVVSGKKFTEGMLKNREQAYSNRGYVWWKVPESLSGWRYTKIDGGVPPEIKVRAKRDTVVQIFTDLADPGLNLSGWERAELQFTFNTTGNPEVVVHEKRLFAGQEVDIPQGNWAGGLVLLPPAVDATRETTRAPELAWLIGKTWSTKAGNSLEFLGGGEGVRTTNSGRTPFSWRILPSGLVEVVLKESPPLTLYVEVKNAAEGAFGNSPTNRPTQIHVR